jgi:hypothetical protein
MHEPRVDLKSKRGFSFGEWAWADLNGRPHAYQADFGGLATGQDIVNSLMDRAICTFPDPAL